MDFKMITTIIASALLTAARMTKADTTDPAGTRVNKQNTDQDNTCKQCSEKHPGDP